VLLELEPSGLAWANALDISGFVWATAMLRYFPWRALAITCVAEAAVVGAGGPAWVGIVVLAGGLVLMARERLNNRDFLTATSLVRQRGMIRTSRRELRLTEIDEVRYATPDLAAKLGCGDIEVVSGRRCWTYTGVTDPESKAQTILKAKEAAAEQALGAVETRRVL
jgi:hypothetical protein